MLSLLSFSMLDTSFSQRHSIKLRILSSIPVCVLSVFITKGCWILSNAFSVSIEINVVFPINVVYYIDFHMSNQPRFQVISPFSWYVILFICCWTQFACNLLKAFESPLTRDIGM